MSTETEAIRHRILILGGGFGGVAAARRLARNTMSDIEIQLVTDKSYLEYYPALYRILTSSSPIEVCVPLSDMLPERVRVDIDSITSINITEKYALGKSGTWYSYDTLIVALGNESAYFNIPNLQNLSLGFRSAEEALKLKHHLAHLFAAHAHQDKNELVSHYHIVVVGGGPSGVEVAGDLMAHMHALAHYHKTDPSLVTVDIIESNNRLLAMLPEDVSARILARLRKLGVNIFLNRQLVKNDIEEVYLKDMTLETKTLIWTAGTQLNSIVAGTKDFTFTDRRRVAVNEYMEAVGCPDVFVIGDAAGTKYSGLAQTAIYDGKYVATVISNRLSNKKSSVYIAKDVAFSIPVGSNWGVFSFGKIRIYGYVAYLIRHGIDFMYFGQVLSPAKFVSIFLEGFKYRKPSDE